MHKKTAIIMLCIFMSSFLSSCANTIEINNYAYVTMLGIDQGTTDKLHLTFQIPKFNLGGGGQSSGGGGGGGGGGSEQAQAEKENISVEGPSLLSSVEVVNSSIPLVLNFMHLKAIVVSEELAMSGNLNEYVGTLIRYRQIRGSTSLIICKGKAEDFVKATKPYLGSLVTQTLENLYAKSKVTGLFPNQTLSRMYSGIKSPYRQILGIYGAVNKGENLKKDEPPYSGKYKIPADYYAGDAPRKGGQDIELLGSTISSGDTMVGKLTGFETQMTLLVLGELTRAAFTIQDPQKPEFIIAIEVKEFDRPKKTVDLSGDHPKIHVKIGMEGDITGIQSEIDYDKPEMKKIVENAFAKFIKEGIERTYAKCRALKSDVFEFGAVAVRQFWTIQEWENYNWLDKFSKSELTVEVNFTVRRTGKLLRTVPEVSGRENK